MKFTRHSRLSANASPDLQIDREFSSAVQLSCRVVFRKPASSLSFPVLRNHPPRGLSRGVESRGTMLPNADETRFRPSGRPPQIQGIGRNFREKDPRFQTFSSPIWPALDFSPCSFRFDFLSQGNEILNGCPLESAFLAMFDVLLPLLPLGQVSV